MIKTLKQINQLTADPSSTHCYLQLNHKIIIPHRKIPEYSTELNKHSFIPHFLLQYH